MINLAYRLLGSLAEAEDAVQETYARWYALSAQQRDAIASPGAWLTTVASRICLDLLGSARPGERPTWRMAARAAARSGGVDWRPAGRRGRPGRLGHPR